MDGEGSGQRQWKETVDLPITEDQARALIGIFEFYMMGSEQEQKVMLQVYDSSSKEDQKKIQEVFQYNKFLHARLKEIMPEVEEVLKEFEDTTVKPLKRDINLYRPDGFIQKTIKK